MFCGLMANLPLMFLITLTAMLFRPPDLQFYGLDRWALALLCALTILRVLLLQTPLFSVRPMMWPMAGMIVLAVVDIGTHPYEVEAWSVMAAKWVVPFVLFHLARFIFDDPAALRILEVFTWIVLGYLILIAVLFFVGAKSWILPAFITDEGLGIHADRARGPFLQAVANGMTLNILGLLALDSYRRKRMPAWLGLVFLLTLPVAIAATLTRAVWLSFAGSAIVLLFSAVRKVKQACLFLIIACALGALAGVSFSNTETLTDRLNERSPVEFRMAIYEAGWEMFLTKPLQGWGFAGMQRELTSRISEFHQEEFFFHNTFLEVVVQYGLLGLALYLWVVIELFRLGRRQRACWTSPPGSLLDRGFRQLWPVLLMVYFLNGCFVVLNYQFVNGLTFSLAGLMAAQNHSPIPTGSTALQEQAGE